jgi:hypothetical protein
MLGFAQSAAPTANRGLDFGGDRAALKPTAAPARGSHPVLQIAGELLLFGASYQVIFRDRTPSRTHRRCRALARPRRAARGLFGQFVINGVAALQDGPAMASR